MSTTTISNSILIYSFIEMSHQFVSFFIIKFVVTLTSFPHKNKKIK